jgi:two-component system sensor histidine kinase ResE
MEMDDRTVSEPNVASDSDLTEGRWMLAVDRKRVLAPDMELHAVVTASRLEHIAGARLQELALALCALLISGLCTAAACVLLTRRAFDGFAHQARRIASGDYEARLPVVGNDGAAAVARSLNELAAELQLRIDDLQRTIDRFDRTLDAIEAGVVLWNADGELELNNRAMLTLVDAPGVTLPDSVNEFLGSQLSPGRRRAMLPQADSGESLVVDLVVAPTRDGGIVQVVQDASNAVAIEEARTNFLVTAAHELRTPLSPLVGFLPLAITDTSDGDAATIEIARDEVQRAAARVDAIVSALFDASLVATGSVPMAIRNYDIEPIVEYLASKVGADHPRISIELPEDLRAAIDPNALETVLAEIIDNAAKYGAGPITITGGWSDAGHVTIEVRDFGPGLAEDDCERVFTAFFRADPEMHDGVSGAGLGLFTARKLIEAMNGSMTISSGDDGTVVRIVVPDATDSLPVPPPLDDEDSIGQLTSGVA